MIHQDIFVNLFKRKKEGFTLIELLLVIGILVVLISGVIVAINPVEQFKKARNAARDSNIKSIQDAVYAYQVDNRGNFPSCIPDFEEVADVSECETELVPDFIAKLPEDPLSGENYKIGFLDESQTRLKIYSTALEYGSEFLPPEEEEEEEEPPFVLPVTSGLVLRLDAQAIEGLSNGNPVSQWNDTSGQGNHATQTNASLRPVYLSGDLLGKPVVNFTGDFLTLNKNKIGNTELFANNTDNFSVFVVAKATGAGAFLGRGGGTGGSATYYLGHQTTSGGRAHHVLRGTTTQTPTGTSYYIHSDVWNVSSFAYYLNGALNPVGVGAAALQSRQITIGATNNGSSNRIANGYIAELLIYDRALSGAERESVEQYLNTKWFN